MALRLVHFNYMFTRKILVIYVVNDSFHKELLLNFDWNNINKPKTIQFY